MILREFSVMKKFLKIIPAIILSVFLLSTFSVAFAEEIPSDDKAVTGVRLVIDKQKRFVKLGDSPDFTDAKISLTYYDGSTKTLDYDEKYLKDFKKDTLGRCLATFDVDGNVFTEYFIVSDESIDVKAFEDVYKDYWGYRQIQRCVNAGFFVGVSKTLFGISDNMTRAQFCQMIYQIYQNDESVMSCHKQAEFTDVASDMWYFKAITACAESEIVSGMGDGTFSPDSPITRQDVAVIMMRILLGTTGADTVDIELALKYAREQKGIKAGDFDLTAGYAKKYVAAALGVIYYGDKEGNINPTQNITRTECAAMISNLFFDGYTDPEIKRVVYLSPENIDKEYAIYDRKDPVKSQYTERIQMYLVAEKVSKILTELGYEVHIAPKELSIRDEDNNRALEAQKLGADCYVALHTNAANGTNSGKVQGTTGYYNGNNKGSKELSEFIYKEVAALTPTKDLGNHDDMKTLKPFAEVRLPVMANILLEIEFHDYAPYATWIVNNTDNIAKAIATGIDNYLKTL